jgi:hypothetical protein
MMAIICCGWREHWRDGRDGGVVRRSAQPDLSGGVAALGGAVGRFRMVTAMGADLTLLTEPPSARVQPALVGGRGLARALELMSAVSMAGGASGRLPSKTPQGLGTRENIFGTSRYPVALSNLAGLRRPLIV